MFPETIVALLAWIMLVTTTVHYNSNELVPIAETWALYMTPSCPMLKEGFQPMPLPFKHYVVLPCPFIEKNRHRKLPRCSATTTKGKVCWTKKVDPATKVLCPDCTYGLVYYHNFDAALFVSAYKTLFPIITSEKSCNQRLFRKHPSSYIPLKTPKPHQLKPQKNGPNYRPDRHKQSHR